MDGAFGTVPNLKEMIMTNITLPIQADGFDETLANAFLLLLRDGLSDLSTGWKADAFAFIRAQDGGLAQYFDSVEYAAALSIATQQGFDLVHFEDAAPQAYAVGFGGELVEFGLAHVEIIGLQSFAI